jgi:uncharacterized protein (DUF3084 family)
MKVVPPIKTFSNTSKANETPRDVLLERDVTLLFNENRKLKQQLEELTKEKEKLEQKNARLRYRNRDLKTMMKVFMEEYE